MGDCMSSQRKDFMGWGGADSNMLEAPEDKHKSHHTIPAIIDHPDDGLSGSLRPDRGRVRGWPTPLYKQLVQEFKDYDHEGDNRITVDEMKEIMHARGIVLEEKEFKTLVMKVMKSTHKPVGLFGHYTLTMEEYLQAMAPFSVLDPEHGLPKRVVEALRSRYVSRYCTVCSLY
eukprot:TRINITY_DN203_c0_g1_i1.p1 TRINITY_DN203_c0_g1~~TRINITY_DN203_c0_g1_i1.p1  ORF type:complete len:173 (+),score=13.84 TRINITY_DN203_c0_g1_i1:248-766(+)